jgi:hypothetical protein
MQKNNSKLIPGLIIVVLIVVGYFAFSKYLPKNSVDTTSNPYSVDYQSKGDSTESKKYTDIGSKLFVDWLKTQKYFSEYTINEVIFVGLKSTAQEPESLYFYKNASPDAFIVRLNYSIKPNPNPQDISEAVAGNGNHTEDGWVRGKSLFVTIDKNASGEYAITNMGTGL